MHRGEVTAMCFLGSLPALLTGDSTGMVCFWPTRPAPVRYQYTCLVHWQNGNQPITAIKFSKEDERVYIGDEQGIIRSWSLDQLVSGAPPWLRPVKQRPDWMVGTGVKGKEEEEEEGTDDAMLPAEIVVKDTLGGRAGRRGGFAYGADSEIAEPTLLAEWQAHKDSISSLDIISETDCILSASYDCCVRLWDRHSGKELGLLHIGPNPEWTFPKNKMSRADTESRKRALQLMSLHRVQQAMNRKSDKAASAKKSAAKLLASVRSKSSSPVKRRSPAPRASPGSSTASPPRKANERLPALSNGRSPSRFSQEVTVPRETPSPDLRIRGDLSRTFTDMP